MEFERGLVGHTLAHLLVVMSLMSIASACGGAPSVLDEARAADAAGQPSTALALYRVAAASGALEAADVLAMHYLLRDEARMHAGLGWWQQAESLWLEAAELDVPPSLRADTLQRVVDLRISVGADPGQTAVLLEAAHVADPSVDRMVELADLWQLAGDSSASLRALEAAVERAPDDLALLLALAGALNGAGRDTEALALYEDVLVRDSTHSQALVMVATIRERAGDTAGAETAWQTLVDAWPDVPGGWIRFAAFVERTGDHDRAAMLRARAASIAEAR